MVRTLRTWRCRLARRCRLFVLPSFYEGLPLVLVEALACGCRLICTRLPGVVEALAEPLSEVMTLVDLPRLDGPDTPVEADLPAFTERLAVAIEAARRAPPVNDPTATARPFRWSAVFSRVEALWHTLLA